jgi:hypothetical protein
MTTKKIEALTEEQKAKFGEYRDTWIDIGLSTEPVDFEKAKDAVCMAYELVGLPLPTKFLTAKGPMDAIRIIQEIDPKRTKREIYNEMIYGAHDAYWLAFYAYFRDVVGLECCNKLNGLIELAKHCGWLNVYDDLVVFQDRPERIKFDDQNRLHCEDGPAIRYRDGFCVYAWHGTRIPAEWIENKEKLNPEIALTWENIEQRRCACEILGWNKILKALDAQVLDEDEDPEIGTLLEVEIPEIGKEKFLRVMCGTGREFALPVPPDMKTALDANAWTFGFDKDSFLKPEIRT